MLVAAAAVLKDCLGRFVAIMARREAFIRIAAARRGGADDSGEALADDVEAEAF